MIQDKEIKFTVRSKLAEDVLLRAIDTEIYSLSKVMNTADQNDFMQYTAYIMAEEQRAELKLIRYQLEKQKTL